MRTKLILLLLLLSIPSSFVLAQEELGKIQYQPKCADAAESYFIKGLLYLHNFNHKEAAEQFLMAQLLDPEYVLGYWGEALCYYDFLSGHEDFKKGHSAILKLGVSQESRLDKANDEVERGLLLSTEKLFELGQSKYSRDTAYFHVIEDLYKNHPQNEEVNAFYALRILEGFYRDNDLNAARKAADICSNLLQKNPQHPGALNYLVMANSHPNRAFMGMDQAGKYAQYCKDAYHAHHAVSHIYAATGMWEKAAAENNLAWKNAEAYVEKKKLSLEDRKYHILWWLAYTDLQEGNYSGVKKLMDDMYRDTKYSKTSLTRFHFILMRAAYLVDTDTWSGAVAQMEVPTYEMDFYSKMTKLFIDGMLAYHKNDKGRMDWIIDQIVDGRSINRNEKSSDLSFQTCYLTHAALKNEHFQNKVAEIYEYELKSLKMVLEGNQDAAIEHAKKAAAVEAELPVVAGPALVVKPAYEHLGDILANFNMHDEAIKNYDTGLSRHPNRTRTLIGKYHSQMASGKMKDAGETKALILKNYNNPDKEALAAIQ